MPMPSFRAAAGLGDLHRLTFPAEFAGSGLQGAIDHLDEGRLSRAVFAQKCMDFARLDSQRHVVIGPERPEHLYDMQRLKQIFRCSPSRPLPLVQVRAVCGGHRRRSISA